MVSLVVLAGAKVANKTEKYITGYVILFLKWLLPQTCMEVTVHNYKDTWYEHVDLICEHVASN